MFLVDLLFALFISVPLTIIFAVGFLGHRTFKVIFGFFIILFIATWAGGVWITPLGPTAWGVYWFSFLVVGSLLAILLAALIPPARRKHPEQGGPGEAIMVFTLFNTLFWLFVVGLIIAIFLHYRIPG